MPVDMIFLLGTYPANPLVLGPEYDLLVLINTDDKRQTHEFESLIANRCHDFAMITVSVYQNRYVSQMLKKENPFFTTLCRSDNVIYNSDQLELHVPYLSNYHYNVQFLSGEFAELKAKAESFLSGAINFRITSDFQLAAFMLHQTVEHCLNAFLSPLIGHRIQTHNLNRLFIFARRFSIRFYEIFPRNSDPEIQLYQLLHKAYIYGRYKNNFQVSENSLHILIERATALLELTEVTFHQKMELLQAGSTSII